MMKNTIYILLALCLPSLKAAAQVQTTGKGVQCQIFSANPGKKLSPNDVITFQAVQKTEKDSVLFSTYEQGQPIRTQIRPSTNPADLMDVFPLLSVNDSAVIKVPVDTVFKGHETEMPAMFTKGGYMVFNIKVLKAQTLEEAMAERNAAMAKLQAEATKLKTAESASLAEYLKTNKLAPRITPSGLRYIVKTAGKKPKPLSGDTVYVNYTGRTLDGKVFDSSIEEDAKAAGLNQPGRTYEPISFAVGTSRVIKGWDEGLLLLNEGSKATFIIPSNLAYGEHGAGEDIKPFSPLVFDLELVKVVRVPHKTVTTPLKKKTAVRKRSTIKKKN
ncbi:FKBP-type peptidyl-prolyl cis-trans isomerase [Mucilaginibacter litoreus]|uniref:peptidylprolyl isomerase n=1 Tax=Mucilaginibacter litoreus TaxID=1048221 RepID=A0ABW3AVJ5_9SPHI